MSHASGPENEQAVDYTGVLRRRWWVIVVAALVGTAGAFGYYTAAHKNYTATASVYVTATAGTANQVANGRTTGAVNLDTEAQIVQSVTVAQAAAKLMHAKESPEALISRVTVTVPPNSQVLSISCEAGSAHAAVTCAQSFAQAYLNYISSRTTAVVNSQLLVLQNKISALQAKSAKLSVEIASLPSNSSQRASANQQLSSNTTELSSLNSQLAQLTQQLANPAGGSIISNATPPTSPSSPKAAIVLPSGLVAGLLIGIVIAFVVDRKDRRIRGPRDVARFNVPVLMSLPRTSAPELAIAAPRSEVGRGFSELAQVLSSSLESGNHVVLVTGSSDGHGAAWVAANLAVALSRYQPEVTLVCANLNGSFIPDMVGLPSAPGLTDLLDSGTLPNGNVGRKPKIAPRLRVITPGSESGTEAADIQPDAVSELLTRLGDGARWVVVEASPVTEDPDVYAFARAANAVIVVAELPRTRTDQVVNAIEHLHGVGASVLGAVLMPSPKTPAIRRTQLPVPERGDVAPLDRETLAVTVNGETADDLSEVSQASTSVHGK